MPVAAEADTIETGAHVVHLYEDDADLIATLGAHVAAAIGAGDAALIIATRDHRDGLAAHLEAGGLDVEEARRDQTYVTFDAADTLARFCIDGEIDADEFRSVIGAAIRSVSQHTGRAVRCHGEMVALLWDAGTVTAALELENLWNVLGSELGFSLLCSYRTQSVAGPEHAQARQAIRHLHSDVLHSDTDVLRSPRSGQPRSIEKPSTRAALTTPWWLHLTLEVHLATGMVAAQFGTDTAKALDHLRRHAIDNGEILEVVARAVVTRELRLHSPPSQGEP
ncbi:MEDS domain-containing protein [Knoellia sp. S7-12]|uniref:MEDS domain-containing protein n=1 Tax=Knoellia sp. S7-12 TaxID=3126698 RepID=UPI00336979D0